MAAAAEEVITLAAMTDFMQGVGAAALVHLSCLGIAVQLCPCPHPGMHFVSQLEHLALPS